MSRGPLLAAAALALLALITCGVPLASADHDRAAREVIELSRAICAAEVKGDVAALDRIWAEDYTQVSSLGHLDGKKRELSKWPSGIVSFDRVEITEIRAAVYGGAATTTERVAVKGRIGGRPVEADERVLRVYARRHRRWQCVNAQYTRIVPGGE
jgi:ketosteroid isomerase-like protein